MRYQVIESKIWYDEQFVKLTPMQQRLFLYLLTCPHGNFIGIFVLKPAYATGDLDISEDAYLNDLKSLSHFIEYDEETNVIWIKNLLRYGARGKLNQKQKAGAVKLIGELPRAELIQNFVNYYQTLLGDLPIPQQIGVSTGSEYTYGKTDTDTDTDSDTKSEPDSEKETDSERKATPKQTSQNTGSHTTFDYCGTTIEVPRPLTPEKNKEVVHKLQTVCSQVREKYFDVDYQKFKKAHEKYQQLVMQLWEIEKKDSQR